MSECEKEYRSKTWELNEYESMDDLRRKQENKESERIV